MSQLFNYGSQAEYDAARKAGQIEDTSLYFVLDTQRLYKGFEIVAMTSVFFVTEAPQVTDMKEHTLYVTDDKLVYAKVGSESVVLNHELISGAISSLTLFADEVLTKSDDNVDKSDEKLMTEAAIMQQIEQAVQGAAHDVEFDNVGYVLTVPMYGKEDLKIHIPSCIKSGRYEEDYPLPNPPGGSGPALVLVIDDPISAGQEKEIVIPVAAFIQPTYVGGTTKSIKISISDSDNVIKGEIIIDPKEKHIVLSEDGVKLDLSEFAMKANPQDVDKVAVIDADGNYLGSKKILDTQITGVDVSDYLPTVGIVGALISEAIQSAIEGDILPPGDPDIVVVSTEKGITRSDMKIGGNVLNPSSTDKLLATEKAVIDAVSWKAAT